MFPALCAGFERGDPHACFLLGRTSQNIIAMREVPDAIRRLSQIELFEMAYSRRPDAEAYRESLLAALMSHFGYLFHEWPAGILDL